MGCFSFTFDMDDLDVLREGYGLDGDYPSVIYDRVVPRMLKFLDDQGVKATFFIIADKITDQATKARLKEIVACGHELANHSYRHAHYLGMSYDQTYADIKESTEIIGELAGRDLSGFRGPSLTFNEHTPAILREMGYKYDSSIHPTPLFIGEWLYLMFNSPSRRNRPDPFFLKHAIARRFSYEISDSNMFKRESGGGLVELPISVVSPLRIPFYPTFHFMFKFMRTLTERFYFQGNNLVFLAHALDFINRDEDNIPAVYGKHPGVDMPWPVKKEYFETLVAAANKTGSEIVVLEAQADKVRAGISV